MFRLIFFLLFSILTLSSSAQNISLKARHKLFGDSIIFKPKDWVSLEYTGYLGQTEQRKFTILTLNDSTFVLGKTLHWPLKNSFGPQMIDHVILVKDVKAFRHSTPAFRTLKGLYSFLTLAGSIGLSFYLANERDQISYASAFFIGLGTGFVFSLSGKLIFPEHPNKQINPLEWNFDRKVQVNSP